MYFATGICSFCWVLRRRSAGFAGFSVLRGRREHGWVDFVGRDFQAGREDFVSRIMLSSQEHLYMGIVIWALLCRGNVGKHEDNVRERSGCSWERSGCEVRDLGGIVYFATGICSFCWVLRGRSAGFAGFSVLRGRREQGRVDFFRWGFRVGLSGGAFGWGFRVGREDYVSRPRLSSQRGNGDFRWFFGREDFVSRIMLSSQEHLYMGIVVQGKCWETRGQRQGGHIVFIARLWTFVGGVGVRSTGFGWNRVLRDRNLFILLGFEGAKCRI